MQASNTRYQILSAAFCVIAVVSNIISAKLVALPFLSLTIPAGLLTYPLTFLLSDLVTEIYGANKSRQMVYIAFGMSLLSVGLIQFAIVLPGAGESAFNQIMGVSWACLVSSLLAYGVSQLVGIQIYALIKQWTGDRFLWLRNNGANVVSQMADTLIFYMLFLRWGFHMEMSEVLPIMLFSYGFKTFFSFANTPLFYLGVFLMKRGVPKFVGHDGKL